MGNSQPKWSANGNLLPVIDPHTKAKHQIIETYIENLIITLYGKGRYGVTTFTFVDGFCGGGMYNDQENHSLWEGSPIRIINAVRRGFEKSRRKLTLDVKFIFIDNNREHLSCLKNYAIPQSGLEQLVDEQVHEFEGNSSKLQVQCEFMYGAFEEKINSCVLTIDIRKGHSFFLLDPFGWTDVSMESLRKINSLKGSEILYTYMIDYIKRFVIGKYGNETNSFNRILEAEGYYEQANLDHLDRIGEQCYLRNESMRLFREKSNARYVFTFSLISKGDIRVLYYLIHISQNLTALEVIKESFWKENNLHYQYYFEIYGHGFRTADFYEREQLSLQFNITKSNQDFCVEKLDQDLWELIHQNSEGIQFRELCELTIELNPASRQHYIDYINFLRNEKRIEVSRKGKRLTGSKIDLQRDDIIKYTGVQQLWLF